MMCFDKFRSKYNLFPAPVKSAFWFTIASFMQRGISVITTPIWTRLFTSEEFGKFSIFNSWKSILTVFVTFNLAAGVFTRGLLKYEENQEDFVSSMEGLLSLISLVFLAIYIPLRSFWNSLLSLSTPLILCMFAMMWTETVFAFWAARQQFNYRYKKMIAITLSMSLMNPFVGIVCVLFFPNQKVEVRIFSMTILQVIAYTGFFFVQLSKSHKIIKKDFWRFAILFNLPLVPHYLSQTVLNSSDRIMIGKMCTEREAGLYSLAYSVAMLLTMLNTSIQQAFNPWLYRKIKAGEYKGIAKSSYAVLSVVACVNLLFIVFAPELVRLFAPAEYLEAVWTMPPVTMSVFFMFMYCLFADFEFYYEKTIFIAVASVIGATLNVALNYFFIPKFNYIAAGYTTLICYILYVTAHYFAMMIICKKNIGKVQIYNPFIIIAISVLFMLLGFSVMLLYRFPIVKYAVLIFCFVSLLMIRKKLKKMLFQFIEIQNGKLVLR